MKKMAVLAFALIMMISGSVFAAGAVVTLPANVSVNNVVFSAGTQGTAVEGTYTYANSIVVNGTTYPAGTAFQVVNVHGVMVPVASASGGALAGTAAVVGTGGALSATTVLATVGAAGLAAAVASQSNATVVTVTR